MDDLDYFVEMLAGTKDEAKVEQITRKATDAMQQQRKPRPGEQAAPAPANDKFINAEHILQGHKGFVFDIAVHVATRYVSSLIFLLFLVLSK